MPLKKKINICSSFPLARQLATKQTTKTNNQPKQPKHTTTTITMDPITQLKRNMAYQNQIRRAKIHMNEDSDDQQEKRPKVFGAWASPITSDVIVGSAISLMALQVDRTTNSVYWIEGRPLEGGCCLPAGPIG